MIEDEQRSSDAGRVGLELQDLQDLPLQRSEHTSFLTRGLGAADNITV